MSKISDIFILVDICGGAFEKAPYKLIVLLPFHKKRKQKDFKILCGLLICPSMNTASVLSAQPFVDRLAFNFRFFLS